MNRAVVLLAVLTVAPTASLNTAEPPHGCTGYGYCYPQNRTDASGETECSGCICPNNTVQEGPTDCRGVTSCTPNPCGTNYVCSMVGGTPTCSCAPGYTGQTCTMLTSDPCATTPCLSHGTCSSPSSTYVCACDTGYYGEQCQYAGDPCTTKACKNGATCEMLYDDTTAFCHCTFGYYSDQCETTRSIDDSYVGCYDDSSSFTNYYVYSTGGSIKNGPDCMDALVAYRKQYPNSVYNYSTMSGSNKQCLFSTVNLLTDAPTGGGLLGGLLGLLSCQSGTVSDEMGSVYFLKDLCAQQSCGEANGWGECVQTSKSAYHCICSPLQTGATCQTPLTLTPCDGVDCGVGTCVPTDDTIGHYCRCDKKNQTETCVANPCTPDTCLYGGTCVDFGNGTFQCICTNLYTSTHCEVFEPCYVNKCLNGGTCVSNYNSLDSTFTCNCTIDWRGDLCEIERWPCDDEPCKNDGVCENDRGPPKSYNCTCTDAWQGQNCTEDVNECLLFPGICNGHDAAATCVNTNGSFYCNCSANWMGATCNINRIIYEILNLTYGYVNEEDLQELTTQLTNDPTLVRDIIPFLIGGYSLETRMNLSWTISDLFLWVAYEQKRIDLEENFYMWNDKVLGNCFTFNHRNSSFYYQSRMSGYPGGLELKMSVNQPEYLPWIDTSSIQVFTSMRDQVIVSESPLVNTRPSFGTRIALARVDYKRLGGKYGRCVKDKSEVKSYYYDGIYTTDGCLRSCYQDVVNSTCHCMDPRYPMPDSGATCRLSSKGCIDSMVKQRGDPSKWSECDCPLPCAESQYSVSCNTMPFVSQPEECASATNQTACMETNNDVVYIEIGFPTVQYQIFVESPAMDFETFLSNMGGVLGVLIGISIISVIEVVFLVVQIIVILISKRSL